MSDSGPDSGPGTGGGAGGELTRLTVTPFLVAELLAGDERMPVYVHVIDHPEGRVLVDTGLTELHPAVADMDPRLIPFTEPGGLDPDSIDIVVNTHLHFDHCGGNHLFAGKPTYVQRRELDDALGPDDYTVREWVEAPGVEYVPVDGPFELLPGIRLVPAPGHTPGSQVVVVGSGERPVVICGDTAVFLAELDDPSTEGQRLVRALEPQEVWLSHTHEPWRPSR
ncbi:MBL fold metallo-hydrolase [Pedococcus ginsenosidimutans]|uniref:MBL fold metallo-hydrolase n=1 Tax=Pedococcus ginsenosidimutans TaxID=490570 RepID=A0ABP8YJD5_9MICO